jgi:DNA repair protein RecO (recombination protein O)
MRPHSYSGEGFVLARRNFGEADRILSIYTKNIGRISLMAKGIRRPKSKKRGHLEIFSLVKFQAITGHGIDLMTEADIIDDFKDIRKSLAKVSLAYYFMEVIGKITHEGEPNTDLFNLLLDFLNTLNKTNSLKKLRLNFILKLLTLMGYWPDGKEMGDADTALEEVIERGISSMRVGKRVLN